MVKSSRGRLAQWKTIRFVIFRPRGPRFESRRGLLFRRDLFFIENASHICLTENPTIGRVTSTSHNLDTEKAVATISHYWVKENVAQINWPYDELDRWRHISYYAILQSTLITSPQLSAFIMVNLWRTAKHWLDEAKWQWVAQTYSGTAGKEIGQQDRSWDTPWKRGWPV